MPGTPDLTQVTQGMVVEKPDFTSLVTMGFPVLPSAPLPNPSVLETPPELGGPGFTTTGLSAQVLADLQSTAVRDTSGNLLVPSAFGLVDLGAGHRLEFDDESLAGRITPALATEALHALGFLPDGGQQTFTGSDCRVMIEIADLPAGSLKPRFSKQLLELTTLTVSIHRSKAPVAAAGFINTKGFARGRRTVAGTMIFTKFTAEVLMRFLQASIIADKSKDSHYMKCDQLPPFNLSILFTNEFGYASYQRLLGVEFVTDGSIYSVQDMLSEQTMSFMASDFTPLLPLTLSSLFQSGLNNDRTTKQERTVRDAWTTLRT